MLGDFKKPRTYYEILRLKPDTTDIAVREAYLELLKRYEADKNPRTKLLKVYRIRLLNEAYAALRTEAGRNRYNRLLLTAKGRPKGLSLKPDNDNKRVSNDRGLLARLSDLLKSSSASSAKKEQDNV